MTRDPYHHVATAIRLATGGVSVSELATACGIHHTTAHTILTRLHAEGLLDREGGRGRTGHVYKTTPQSSTSNADDQRSTSNGRNP